MAFRVDVTLKAYRDLSGILRWLLAEHAGEQGLSWYDSLIKQLTHPLSGWAFAGLILRAG
jgi:hypothetical protein